MRFISRLERGGELTGIDKDLISNVPMSFRSIEPRADIVREGDIQDRCCCVLSGQVVSTRLMDTSRRRILSFHVAGDIPDLRSLQLRRSDHNMTALGSVVVGLIPHQAFHALVAQSPRLANAFWREAVVEASILREWDVSLWGREGTSRVAHFLCEMMLRLQAVGLSNGSSFDFPWTQQDIGDACGLSNVHVNRVVQALRLKQIIDWRRRVMKILNLSELARIGEFSSSYLHLPEQKRKGDVCARTAQDGSRSRPEWDAVGDKAMSG